jgi:spore photoproduct lyase
VPDAVLILNTFRFDGRRADRQKWLWENCRIGGHLQAALAGYGPFCWWDVGLSTDRRKWDNICRPCWRLHFQNGCLHKCRYCALGGLLVAMVNVEEYLQRLARLIELHPWQETYLLEDDAEVLCLEPELDCLGRIIEFFGRLEGRYLVIHSKSANVDWMLNLDHRGRTIVVWSIATRGQDGQFEPAAASMTERIEAARKLQEAGYTVRYKFKPIIPVKNWREDAAEAVRMIFERTRPDVISLCVLMWHDFEWLEKSLDLSLLDADCVAAARAAAVKPTDSRCLPFPPSVRAAIYEHYIGEIRKHDADVPVSLSTENAEVWGRLGPLLGSGPRNYVCGCGPNSTPGRKSLVCDPFQLAAAGPVGGFEEM